MNEPDVNEYDEDLRAIARLAGTPPRPSAAVLAAARPAAGAAGDLFAVEPEPLVLQPRSRRRRRRTVSLTVALAATGIAASVVAVTLTAAPGHRVAAVQPAAGGNTLADSQPSGLVTPTDAELASARWFHVQSHVSDDPQCPGNRDVWFDRSAEDSVLRQPAEGGSAADSCAVGSSPLFGPASVATFTYGDLRTVTWSQLSSLSPTETQLAADMRSGAHGAGNGPDEEYAVVIADTLRESPVPSTLRHELVDLLGKAKGVTSTVGVDGAGRPVLWMSSRNGGGEESREWWGFDEVTDWMIAESTGPAGPSGNPVRKGDWVEAIDTAAPPTVTTTVTPASGAPTPAPVTSGSPAPYVTGYVGGSTAAPSEPPSTAIGTDTGNGPSTTEVGTAPANGTVTSFSTETGPGATESPVPLESPTAAPTS